MFQDCRYWQAQRINLLNKWIQKIRVCSTSRENSFQEACAFSVNLSGHMRLVWGMSWELVYHSPPQLSPKPKAQSPEWQWAHVPMSSAEEDHWLRSSVGLDTQRKERKKAKSLGWLYPTLCNPVDCSPPGSSVHGIFQARLLEWVAISFSRGPSRPRYRTWVSRIAGRRFTLWSTREAQETRKPKRQGTPKCVPSDCSWPSCHVVTSHHLSHRCCDFCQVVSF